MKVINPTPIAGAMLAATSVAEDTHAAWSASTSYNKDDIASSSATHRVYQSVAGGNLNHDPTAPGQTAWIDIGPTNRWAMFNEVVGTATTDTGAITVWIQPGAVSSLAIVDTDAAVVQVIVTVGGTPLYNETKSTNAGGGMIADWYAYFTADVGTVSSLVFDDLPKYSGCEIQVLVTGANPSGPVSVGTLIVGNMIDIGVTEAGPTVGINDFSRIATDDFGNRTIVPRDWSKRMTVRSLVQTSEADNIQRRLASLRAKAALYIGEDGFDCLTIYGFYKDFSIDLQLAGGQSYVSFTVDGLI